MALNFSNNRLTALLGCEWPIIQAGMVWCSGWKLARAVSECGGLGVIGAGSMTAELLDLHLSRMRAHCHRPFGVNLPLFYSQIEDQLKVIERHGVLVVTTSAGSPRLYTRRLQAGGARVIHVVSSATFAQKAEDAGVDALICEGVEAGGHNGREETTTLCLVPLVRQAVQIPVVVAGGIGSGAAIAAALALGAEGVQIGSLFVCAEESSAHPAFKQRVVEAQEGHTHLHLRQLTPVRLLDNPFRQAVAQLEQTGAPASALAELLGKGRAQRGMFEGDLQEGELEIGQVSAHISAIEPAGVIFRRLVLELEQTLRRLGHLTTTASGT
jgi:enoyl-[acyl-carrier protein] reductase II